MSNPNRSVKGWVGLLVLILLYVVIGIVQLFGPARESRADKPTPKIFSAAFTSATVKETA